MSKFIAVLAVIFCAIVSTANAGETFYSSKIHAQTSCQENNVWKVTLSDPSFESLTKEMTIVTVNGKKYAGRITAGKITVSTRSQQEAETIAASNKFLIVEI